MKKIFVSSFILMFLTVGAFASPNGVNHTADRQSLLNDMTDSWATFGKTESEKKEIIRRRKIERRQKRLQNIKKEQMKRTLDRYKKK
jgi:hypothetical protein